MSFSFDLGALPDDAVAVVVSCMPVEDRQAMRLACVRACAAVDAHAPLSSSVYVALLGGHPFGAPAGRLPALAARMRRAASLRFLLAPAPTPHDRWEQHDCARRLQARLAGGAAAGPPLQWPSLTAVRDCPATCLREVVALAPNLARLSVICDAGGVRGEDLAFLAQHATALTALRLAALCDPAASVGPSGEPRPGPLCSDDTLRGALSVMSGLRSLTLEHTGESLNRFEPGLGQLRAQLEQLLTPICDFPCRADTSFLPSLRRLKLTGDACQFIGDAWLGEFAQRCAPRLTQLTALMLEGDRELFAPSGGGQRIPLAAAVSPLAMLFDLSLPSLHLKREEVLAIALARPYLSRLCAASISLGGSHDIPCPLFPCLEELACGFKKCSRLERRHLPQLDSLQLGECGGGGSRLLSALLDGLADLTTLELPLPLTHYVDGDNFAGLLSFVDCLRLTAALR